ncbi:hypothetical protein AB7W43_22400 [Providencia rettgeri]
MKGTTLTELLAAWDKAAKQTVWKMYCAAGKPNREQFTSVNAARYRRKYRNRKNRSYAEKVAYQLADNLTISELVGSNRKHFELPAYIYTFGNSGTAKSQREASNAGN